MKNCCPPLVASTYASRWYGRCEETIFYRLATDQPAYEDVPSLGFRKCDLVTKKKNSTVGNAIWGKRSHRSSHSVLSQNLALWNPVTTPVNWLPSIFQSNSHTTLWGTDRGSCIGAAGSDLGSSMKPEDKQNTEDKHLIQQSRRSLCLKAQGRQHQIQRYLIFIQ